MSHGANSLRSIFFALGANLAIFWAKLVAALFTGSGARMSWLRSRPGCGIVVLSGQ